jgi:hypothetical protein
MNFEDPFLTVLEVLVLQFTRLSPADYRSNIILCHMCYGLKKPQQQKTCTCSVLTYHSC